MMVYRTYFLMFVFSFLHSQNVDMYLSLINQGNSKGVEENLPELISKYPKNSGVLYLKALLTEDANLAIKQYKHIIKSLKLFKSSYFLPEIIKTKVSLGFLK